MKRLLLMIYLEIGVYELFLNSFDSYRHFIKNFKHISELRENQNLKTNNFFNLINDLFKLRQNYDHYSADILINKIADMDIDHKIWCLSKLKELKSAK